MKIACLCGKNIGYRMADFLLKQEHEVRFVVNHYEKPGEWYRTPRELPIQEIALEELLAFGPDLLIVAFYDRILKEPEISMPALGAWNLHLADAERYRGAYPNVWALKNGDTEYAVTLHRIDSGVDTGPVLRKKRFPLPSDYTGSDLYNAMTEAGYDLFVECFPLLVSGKAIAEAVPQDNTHAEVHYRRELTREIEVPADIRNQVRALTFPPFPPPFFKIGSRKFIVIEEPE